MSPFIGTAEARLRFAAIASAALHDIFCAIFVDLHGVRVSFKDTLAALKTRSGKAVILGRFLGGPIGMTGYVDSHQQYRCRLYLPSSRRSIPVGASSPSCS